MKGEASITLKDDAISYQESIQRVAHAMGETLKRLVCEGSLVKMDPDEPSDWLNSSVCVRKTNVKIGLCVDLTQFNKYMVRLRHIA